MDDAEVLERLEQVIRPLLESEHFELVELSLGGGRRRRRLCVFADRPGGITVDECARLNRMIGHALDAEDPIEGSYVLEVSSPGLDRLLKTERDFARSTGQKVRVILATGAVHVGVLKACSEGTVVLDISGEPLSLDRSAIAKANLEVEF